MTTRPTAKAVTYARISLDQADDAHGVHAQQSLMERMADERGYEIVDSFTDNDLSASSYSKKPRPAYEAMLARVAAGGIDVVLCRDVDRLLRSVADGSHIMSLLSQHGARLETYGGKVDPSTADGKVLLTLGAVLAEVESDKTSARQKHAARDRRSKGKADGGPTPFGYTRESQAVLAVNEDERAIVVEVFDRLLAGDSMLGIAADASDRGFRTRRGNRWSAETVRNIVESGIAAGWARDRTDSNGAYRKGVHEAIVSEEKWRSAVDLLDGRRSGVSARKRKNLLTGSLHCGGCKRLMKADYKDKYRYYACAPCKNRVSMPKINALVLAICLFRIETAVVDVVMEEPKVDVRAELAALRERRLQMVDMAARGMIDQDEWVVARDRLLSDELRLQTQLDNEGEPIQFIDEMTAAVHSGKIDAQVVLIREALPGLTLAAGRGRGELGIEHLTWDTMSRPWRLR